MPVLPDPSSLRALLDTDRPWALYLLGDLEPHLRPHARWWANEEAVVLLYRRFAMPVLLAFGAPPAVRPLLAEMEEEPYFHLHVRPEILPLLRGRYDIPDEHHMLRMNLAAPVPYAADPRVERLSLDDLAAVETLYGEGAPRNEGPGFFAPEMLADGIYFGIHEDEALCAVAGTHLIAAGAAVAAVGNVYTRSDRRGRGLAASTTAAVLEALRLAGLRTIGLSVRQDNAAAIRVYDRLGFRPHCPFVEGLALRRIDSA